MRKSVLLMIVAALAGTTAMSQEAAPVLTLDLKGAVEYAVANNKNLMNARQELIKSDKSVWEAISQGLPQVDATLDYMTYFNYELEFSFGPSEDFEFTQDQLNSAASQTLTQFTGVPMAGLNPVTMQDIYNHSAGNYYDGLLQGMMPPSTILMSDQMTAKMQVSQLIFSGQYIVGIQTAKLAKMISRQALDNSESDTKENVVNAYYLVLISESSLNKVRQNLDNLRAMLEQTRKMYETGMAELIDVDQFSVTVNQLENTRRAMERNLEMNYNMLRFTLGLTADTDITLTDDLNALFEETEAAELLMRDFNKEQNLAYKILSSQTEISKKMWDLEKWNYGPTIAGFYNYNFKLRTTGFDMTPNHLAGFSVNVPIFSSGMRAVKTTQARIDYEIAERNAEIMGDQLELQESQLKYNLQSSLDNYYTQKENVDVAQRVLDNYRRKYQQGMASSLDVTQANSNYLEAESAYLTAVFEVMNARLQLEKLMNNLNGL
jgi:outer membrane protein